MITSDELNASLGGLGLEDLTEEDKQQLEQEAKEKWNNIDTTTFKKMSTDTKKNIENDFNSTRDILVNNINKLEKLTEIVFENIAQDTSNNGKIQTGILAIKEQNLQLKNLVQLQKLATDNHIAISKLDGGKGKGSKLPDGLKTK